MARVLIVKDDPGIANLVALYLRNDGHETSARTDGLSALAEIESDPTAFELIVLDLMLPGLDGRGVCRRIRDVSAVPIIMLTALDDDRAKIAGLDLGADDYLTKPFNPNELVARVRALLRRVTPRDVTGPPSTSAARAVITVGNASIDLDTRRFMVAGVEHSLRAKEFDLLAALAAHPGMVLTRDQLLERVWDAGKAGEAEFAGDTRTVDVHISRLRDKLASSGATAQIDTIRSVGYRLTVTR